MLVDVACWQVSAGGTSAEVHASSSHCFECIQRPARLYIILFPLVLISIYFAL